MRKPFKISILVLAAFIIGLAIFGTVLATTNISSVAAEHWAWNDLIGWFDFYTTNTVNVTSLRMQGYASSDFGDISLDCATTRIGDICGTSNYFVANDGSGNLSGWGWNDTFGWISFYCGSTGIPGLCSTSPYRVIIDGSGNFSNYAWNDVIGWISFNCSDPGICGTSNYKVKTSWFATSTSGYLDSTTFDTLVNGGAQINSVMWRGTLPSPQDNSWVGFQFATSSSSTGPWSYAGYDGTSNTWYVTAGPNVPKSVSFYLHNNARYFRYRINLVSNDAQSQSPRVDEIIINWSR